MNWTYIAPILLLCGSNVFMTFAWYGQLRFPNTPLWLLIPVCWSIALFEYCLAVPANKIGHQVYSAAQLKTMQEVIGDLSGRGAEMESPCRLRVSLRRGVLLVS